MDNQKFNGPQGLPPFPGLDNDLAPSERFARLAKTVFGVKKSELDDYLKDHPLEPQKRGRNPKDL